MNKSSSQRNHNKIKLLFVGITAIAVSVAVFNVVYAFLISNIDGFHGSLNTVTFALVLLTIIMGLIYSIKRKPENNSHTRRIINR